jgi:hypothetical protein
LLLVGAATVLAVTIIGWQHLAPLLRGGPERIMLGLEGELRTAISVAHANWLMGLGPPDGVRLNADGWPDLAEGDGIPISEDCAALFAGLLPEAPAPAIVRSGGELWTTVEPGPPVACRLRPSQGEEPIATLIYLPGTQKMRTVGLRP